MNNVYNLDQSYSTTRSVTENKPQFDGVLLYPDAVKQGGLRTKGLFKSNSTDKPLITIVTVVYNGAEFLEETIKSVINQTYDNVEYIVVDGGSTDGTLEIIEKYSEQLDYWISQSDKGIYDAMNKGIDLASGDWLNFMNCGDKLIITPEKYLNKKYLMLYGSVSCRNNRVLSVPKKLKKSDFSRGMPICHQSCFYRSDVIKKIKYDTEYKICADQKLTYQIYGLGEVAQIPLVIAHYDLEGISSRNFYFIFKEKIRINRSFNMSIFPVFISALITFMVKFRDFLYEKKL